MAETMSRAIEVFVHGLTFTRSFTHPYLAEQVGPLCVMRDGPRRRGTYRTEEWVAHGVPPAEIDEIARAHTRGRFTICALCHKDESDDPLRAGFKALGYRLVATEPVMVHSLEQIPPFDAPTLIERVTTQALADQVNKVARARQILPEHLVDDAPLKEYAALVDNEVVGWVGGISVRSATWVSSMVVKAAFRRRGIARAMLSRLLQDAKASGSRESILLASHTGAMLYPVVGYEPIGTLFIFTPKRG